VVSGIEIFEFLVLFLAFFLELFVSFDQIPVLFLGLEIRFKKCRVSLQL